MTYSTSYPFLSLVEEKAQSMDFLYADHDFIPEYKIEMAAGRTFQKEITTDTYDSFIINETASQAFGFESAAEAIGKQIYEGGSGNVAPIIGVTRDFHFKGLQTRVEPLVMQARPDMFRYLSLTVKTDNLKDTLSFIEKRWNELQLGEVFSYVFLDEDFNRQYGSVFPTLQPGLLLIFHCRNGFKALLIKHIWDWIYFYSQGCSPWGYLS
ncbi:MAG: hypothetical protein J7L72_01255 [Candidatus Aminicenantes bacterium]|nr:hypothetical protein [Candidatus Aminicenantes bacterium]